MHENVNPFFFVRTYLYIFSELSDASSPRIFFWLNILFEYKSAAVERLIFDYETFSFRNMINCWRLRWNHVNDAMCVNACIFRFLFAATHHHRPRCLRFFTSAILRRQLEDNLKLGATTTCVREEKNTFIQHQSNECEKWNFWRVRFQQKNNDGHRLVCAFNRMLVQKCRRIITNRLRYYRRPNRFNIRMESTSNIRWCCRAILQRSKMNRLAFSMQIIMFTQNSNWVDKMRKIQAIRIGSELLHRAHEHRLTIRPYIPNSHDAASHEQQQQTRKDVQGRQLVFRIQISWFLNAHQHSIVCV